jgi:hypothetical protein
MKTYICCAHAGGQGKTTVAQLLYVAGMRANMKLQLCAADFQDENGASKLGQFYPKMVEELGLGSGLGEARSANDVNASLKYWDILGSKLASGGSIIDMGANVITQVMQWAEMRRAAEVLPKRGAPPIRVFLVCRAERRALDDMGDLVRQFTNRSVFPSQRVVVVMNEVGGNFERMDLETSLQAMVHDVPLDFITLRRCPSELWPLLEQQSVSIDQTLKMSADDAVAELGTDIWAATTGVDDLQSWADEFISQLVRKDLV